MPLNIKSAKAHELAHRVAKATGESLTEAVTVALEERLTRVEPLPECLAAELLAIGKDCAARLGEPWRSLNHGELLYDDKGLPR
jgi:antitoxin VapB